MKFFGVHIEDLESEKFLSATNDQIATWLFLHALCSKLRNSGKILDAVTLPERFWNRHGIAHDVLVKPSPLWSWDGGEITVEPYDISGQAVYEKKVRGGKDGAYKRWNGSPNRSPNRPEIRLPEIRLPEITSSGDDGGGSLFSELEKPSSKDHEVFSYWQSIATLPRIKAITSKRKQQLKVRMKEEVFKASWKTAIDKIPATPFLMGNNDRGWKADIDWLLKPESVVWIMEGKYDHSNGNGSTPTSKPPVNIGSRQGEFETC